MPTNTLHRPNQAPVPVIPGKPRPETIRAVAAVPLREQDVKAEAPRRRGIARKVANFIMNGGRRHAGRHTADAVLNAGPTKGYATPDTTPTARPNHVPERHVQAPKTAQLHYRRGAAEGTKPQEVISVGMHQPLLTREQVNQQLGFEGFGVLQMVVHLPGAKEPLYCFKSTKALGKGNAEVDYRFATPAQLDRMRTAANQATWDEVYEGMIHLNRINTGETKVGSNGTQVTLGRDHWLPGRAGEDHAESPKSSVPSGMEKVAATQLELRIDDVNDLVVHNLATPYDYKMDIDTKHAQPAAVIEVNPTLILAQDEWSHAPINVGRYVLPE